MTPEDPFKDFRENYLRLQKAYAPLQETINAMKGIHEVSPNLEKIAEHYNQIKKSLGVDEKKYFTNAFNDLGIENPELPKYIPVKTQDDILPSVYEVKNELQIEYFKSIIELISLQIKELKEKPKEKLKDNRRLVLLTLGSAIIGSLLTGIWGLLKEAPIIHIDFPKAPLQNDLPYLKDTSITHRDTISFIQGDTSKHLRN